MITLGTNVSETFYVENSGAAMRVLVEGNTTAKKFIVFVHGGTGVSAYIYDSEYIRKEIESRQDELLFCNEINEFVELHE
jgi:hypothetical protein